MLAERPRTCHAGEQKPWLQQGEDLAAIGSRASQDKEDVVSQTIHLLSDVHEPQAEGEEVLNKQASQKIEQDDGQLDVIDQVSSQAGWR